MGPLRGLLMAVRTSKRIVSRIQCPGAGGRGWSEAKPREVIPLQVLTAGAFVLLVFALSAGRCAAATAPQASGPETEALSPAVADLLAGRFRWQVGPPLVGPPQSTDDFYYSIKDPSIVYFQGRWHLFCTIRGKTRSHQIESLSFADFDDIGRARRQMLTMHAGFFCAPQVFYFAPQEKWYLICQASDERWDPPYGAAFSTTSDIADPASWTPLKPLGAKPAGGKAGLDFWVICDDEKAHFFFTTLDGHMWREETSIEEFPHGWSEPALAIRGDIFEAAHVYRLKGLPKYLTVVEAQGGHGWRYFKAYLADRLEGPWTPLAATREKSFASMANTRHTAERWTDCISHGELLRAGVDQHLEVDPARLRFLFQGVPDTDRRGKPYGRIPWRLGLLVPEGEPH